MKAKACIKLVTSNIAVVRVLKSRGGMIGLFFVLHSHTAAQTNMAPPTASKAIVCGEDHDASPSVKPTSKHTTPDTMSAKPQKSKVERNERNVVGGGGLSLSVGTSNARANPPMTGLI